MGAVGENKVDFGANWVPGGVPGRPGIACPEAAAMVGLWPGKAVCQEQHGRIEFGHRREGTGLLHQKGL